MYYIHMYVHIATNFDILDMIYGGLVEKRETTGLTYPHHRTKTTATAIGMQRLWQSSNIKRGSIKPKLPEHHLTNALAIGNFHIHYSLLAGYINPHLLLVISPFVVGEVPIITHWRVTCTR